MDGGGAAWGEKDALGTLIVGVGLCIRRGAVHQFENTTDTEAKALAVVTPGILGPDYFREVASILEAAPGGAPDYAALGEVMRRHGLTCAA